MCIRCFATALLSGMIVGFYTAHKNPWPTAFTRHSKHLFLVFLLCVFFCCTRWSLPPEPIPQICFPSFRTDSHCTMYLLISFKVCVSQVSCFLSPRLPTSLPHSLPGNMLIYLLEQKSLYHSGFLILLPTSKPSAVSASPTLKVYP